MNRPTTALSRQKLSTPRGGALKRLLVWVVLFGVWEGAYRGCTGHTDATATTNQPAASPPAVVRLGYFANLTHAQAVLGVASGEFAKAIAPIKFEAKPPFNAGPSLMEALAAGEIDIGYVGPGPALASHDKSRGEAVRVISGVAANGVVIVASKNSGIHTMAELKGRRIATPQHGNTQDIAARRYVSSVLGQPSNDNVVAVPNAEQAAMMLRGQIDAAWVPEPWGARLVSEAGGTIISEEKDLWPDKEFSLTVVVTTPEFLRAHPDVVEKFLAVHRHWTQRLNTDGDAQLPAIGEALYNLTHKKLPSDVMREAFRRVRFTDDPLPKTFTEMGTWAADLGFSKPLSRLDVLFASKSTTQPASSAVTSGWKSWKFPAPSHVVDALFGMLNIHTAFGEPIHPGWPRAESPAPAGEHWYSSPLLIANWNSALRLLAGFVISVSFGAILGAMMWRSRFLDELFGPLFLGLLTLPSVCWVPLGVLALGINESTVLFVLVMGSVFAVAISMRDGLKSMPPVYRRAGLMLGASGWRLYRYVLFPASLPAFAGSLRQGFSFSWRSLLGAELILTAVSHHGLGFLLSTGRDFGDVAQVVAVMIVMVAAGIIVDRWFFARLQKRINVRFGFQ